MKHTLKQLVYHWGKMIKVIKREWALLNMVVPWKDDDPYNDLNNAGAA